MGRFDQIGFFPYTFNDAHKLVILFQKDISEGLEVLTDFGAMKNEYEMNGYYAAIRSFTNATKGVFEGSCYAGVQAFQDFGVDNLYGCYQSGLKNIFKNEDYRVLHHETDGTMNVFYPLKFYVDSDRLNQDLRTEDDPDFKELVWHTFESLQETAVVGKLMVKDKQLFTEVAQELTGLQDDYTSYLVNLEQCMQDGSNPDGIKMCKVSLPTYGMLFTEPREQWRYQYAGMYIPALIDNHETWKVYHCFDGEYPNEDELKSLKGLVIPGNEDDPDDDFEYLVKAKEMIKLIHTDYPNIKVFGSCAGHQLIAASLGGECAKLDLTSPMVFGKFPTKVTDDMREMPEFEQAFGKDYQNDSICVLRSHGWIVSKPPPGAVVLGECDYGANDIIRVSSQMLSTQCHPEFTEKFEEHHEIIPMTKSKYLTETDKVEQLANIYKEGIHSQGDQFLEFIRCFFKNS
ncbi:unnamed protein product [Moneuplotes crassus]|uniref:Glutamine amidotransferase domain-containing protein n=1 Tax=Euplotes crassus TaxID=5936 RepID=A0AAD1UQ31_EUPCR|nr:unnamed protein product [Moneuplotes crassus]